MKYRTLSYMLPVLLLLIAGSFYFYSNQPTEREKYEDFLLQHAQAFADLNGETDEELKAPDKPDMAAFQEHLKTLDPELGYVPKKRAWESYQLTKRKQEKLKSSKNYESPLEWEGTEANMGGRTRAIMFDPNSDGYKQVWAGGVTGGLWFNPDILDTDETWIAVGDFWPNLAISCITYDPGNTNTFYVGTGEAQTARIIYRESSGVGAGIFRSTDGGDTWELMESTMNFEYVTDIAIRIENNTSVIYAAVASGTYMGTDHESKPSDGLYRSTNDGNTWQQVLPNIPGVSNSTYTPADIEIAENGRIFVGTMENLDGQGGATVLYSDLGTKDSWSSYTYYNTKISNENYYNIPARTIVASAPSDANVVYAQFAAGYINNVNGFNHYRGRYMAKSTDGGENWENIVRPDDDWSTLAWHAFILKVDPSDPDVIFTGGLDLWKSSNAGSTWRVISDWSLMYYGGGDTYVHADQHNIQFQPGNPSTAIFSSDGGVFLTKSANYSYPVFIERNQGYNTLQFYSGAISPSPGAENYLGGLQDNGTLLYADEALDIDDMVMGGDGAYCFWDANESLVYITSSYYNNYRTYYNKQAVAGFGGNSGSFVSPADYDYKLNILYSNGVMFDGSYKNKILQATGIPFNINEQLMDMGTSMNAAFSHVKYSKYSPTGTSTLFLGTTSGRLYKTLHAEAIPETVEIGSPDFPNANISCIALGDSEDYILVTFSNYGVSSVWLTTDGGDTWEEKEMDLPDMPIRWAIIHPQNNGQAMLATETGIWATNTLNEYDTEWTPANDDLANVRIDMLSMRQSENVVLAATHGRGLFTADYELDIYTGQKEELASNVEIVVYPNPASDYLSVHAGTAFSNDMRMTLTDLSGRMVLNKEIKRDGSSDQRINISHIDKGIYILNLSSPQNTFSQKVIIQ